MSAIQISTWGLLLCLAPAIVHGVEVFRPLWARWVVNWVLPIFRPGLPKPARGLNHDDQIAMLDAAIAAAPKEKREAGADYVFLLLFEERQGALAFIAIAIGVIYGMSIGLDQRASLHLIMAVMSGLFALVNANQAGVPFLGRHPKVTRNGRHVGIVFSVFWTVACVLNIMGFQAASV